MVIEMKAFLHIYSKRHKGASAWSQAALFIVPLLISFNTHAVLLDLSQGVRNLKHIVTGNVGEDMSLPSDAIESGLHTQVGESVAGEASGPTSRAASSRGLSSGGSGAVGSSFSGGGVASSSAGASADAGTQTDSYSSTPTADAFSGAPSEGSSFLSNLTSLPGREDVGGIVAGGAKAANTPSPNTTFVVARANYSFDMPSIGGGLEYGDTFRDYGNPDVQQAGNKLAYAGKDENYKRESHSGASSGAGASGDVANQLSGLFKGNSAKSQKQGAPDCSKIRAQNPDSPTQWPQHCAEQFLAQQQQQNSYNQVANGGGFNSAPTQPIPTTQPAITTPAKPTHVASNIPTQETGGGTATSKGLKAPGGERSDNSGEVSTATVPNVTGKMGLEGVVGTEQDYKKDDPPSENNMEGGDPESSGVAQLDFSKVAQLMEYNGAGNTVGGCSDHLTNYVRSKLASNLSNSNIESLLFTNLPEPNKPSEVSTCFGSIASSLLQRFPGQGDGSCGGFYVTKVEPGSLEHFVSWLRMEGNARSNLIKDELKKISDQGLNLTASHTPHPVKSCREDWDRLRLALSILQVGADLGDTTGASAAIAALPIKELRNELPGVNLHALGNQGASVQQPATGNSGGSSTGGEVGIINSNGENF